MNIINRLFYHVANNLDSFARKTELTYNEINILWV